LPKPQGFEGELLELVVGSDPNPGVGLFPVGFEPLERLAQRDGELAPGV
jgi:hypothetical protein